MSDNVLMIFLKYPEPGKVKTRLAKDVGAEKAALLYRGFVEKILRNTESAAYQRAIFFTPQDKKREIIHWLGIEDHVFHQEGKELGEKLHNAFLHVLRQTNKKAVVIGTDSPFINEAVIKNAFCQLENSDCVIGPAKDGGYYLLGLKKSYPELFSHIPWGTQAVFQKTLEKIKQIGLKLTILEEGYDIDTVEDLMNITKE